MTSILIVASSKTSARNLERMLSFVQLKMDVVAGAETLPKVLSRYRLVVWEGRPNATTPGTLIAKLRRDCQVVLILPNLDTRWAGYYLQYDRVNHFFAGPALEADLHSVVDKLHSGGLFGLERHLPMEAEVVYRRFNRFEQRCRAIDELDEYTKRARLRGQVRRGARQVVEELLMNAMYQAPVDDTGRKLFADVDPGERIKRETPRPVSLRFAVVGQTLVASVRDRYGSFRRSDLSSYMLRCATDNIVLEQKKLGAGVGLYLISSMVSKLVINIWPGRVSEFICAIEPMAAKRSLKMLSITTQPTETVMT